MSSKLFEGLKKLYRGKDIAGKQITLFSLIGIVSLGTAYLYLGTNSYIDIKSYSLWAVTLINLLWIFYGTGYETKFMNNIINNNDNNIVPDFNKQPFAIMCDKFPIILFIINAMITISPLLTHKEHLIFIISVFLSIILSLFQIGYAQNYNNKDVLDVFKSLNFKDYLMLTIKKIWMTFLAFLTSYGIVFIIILISGLAVLLTGFSNSKSFIDIMFAAQSSQLALIKITTYLTTILLNYFLIIYNFAWEYDIIENIKQKKGII